MENINDAVYQDTDWFGRLMESRRDAGEPYIANYGRVESQTPNIEWHRIDHCQFDGIGGFAEVLSKLNHNIEKLPADHAPTPSFWPGLKTWWLTWCHMNSRQVRWNEKWRSRFNPQLKHRTTPLIHWHLFSREDTRKIEYASLKQRASTNCYLLAKLSNTAGKEFVEEGSNFHWMIPTNLRGGLKLSDPRANHCSTYSLDTNASASPCSIQDKSRQLTKRGDDWAFYWTIKFFVKLPTKINRWLQKDSEKRNPAIGCFTNLGHWHHCKPNSPVNDKEGWVIVPTANHANPVGAGAITWNGRLSIALEIHPSLQSSEEESQHIFEAWKKAIEKGAGLNDSYTGSNLNN